MPVQHTPSLYHFI